MQKSEGSKPFFESRWFKGIAAVVSLTVAVTALLGPPTLWSLFSGLFSTEPSRSNTEIVLDASAGMRVPYEGGTKFDAAVEAVRDFVIPLEDEALALRRTGGGCGSPGELLVGFGTHQSEKVRDAAATQRPGGSSNLAFAIIAALHDFASSEQAGNVSTHDRVIVITGPGRDSCLRGAVKRIQREVEWNEANVSLSLIAVNTSRSDRTRVRRLAAALDPSDPAYRLSAATATPAAAAAPSVCTGPNVECLHGAPPPPEAPHGSSVKLESREPSSSSEAAPGNVSVRLRFPKSKQELDRVIERERNSSGAE